LAKMRSASVLESLFGCRLDWIRHLMSKDIIHLDQIAVVNLSLVEKELDYKISVLSLISTLALEELYQRLRI